MNTRYQLRLERAAFERVHRLLLAEESAERRQWAKLYRLLREARVAYLDLRGLDAFGLLEQAIDLEISLTGDCQAIDPLRLDLAQELGLDGEAERPRKLGSIET
jgi:hypothetical protein